MIRAALALAMLCLVLPIHAQAQSSGGRGPIPPDVARWMYDSDPERQRERQQPQLAQYSRCWVRDCSDAGKASDAEIAAGIDLTQASKICGGSPHNYTLTWHAGTMTCDDIKWLHKYYQIQMLWEASRPDRQR